MHIHPELARLLCPPKEKIVKLGVLGEGGSATANGQQYAKAPRVAGGKPATGMTAITMRVAGSTERVVIGLGGYYAPKTTPSPPEEEP